jgi:hypothetical protein
VSLLCMVGWFADARLVPLPYLARQCKDDTFGREALKNAGLSASETVYLFEVGPLPADAATQPEWGSFFFAVVLRLTEVQQLPQ